MPSSSSPRAVSWKTQCFYEISSRVAAFGWIVLALCVAGCGPRVADPAVTASAETSAVQTGPAVEATAVAVTVKADAPGKLAFNEHIQPILAENCYHCHGPDPGSRKAGLRLDRAEYAFRPLDKSGPAIVAGEPDRSPLVQRIESTDDRDRMPPPEAHKTLKPQDVAALRRWVAEGAEYQEHWAFIAPSRPAVPQGGAAAGAATPIDAFVRAALPAAGLAPSPEAERPALLRRVAFDLTGLPPTPEEVEQFLNDRDPGAYERAVDRFLASPRFGEHRARYWLDYVRYADTHGIHFDNYRSIWPYRDYVVDSFNRNKPFDRFVIEQLAGDLLPARSIEEVVATGMMRCNLTTNEGGTIPEEIYVNQTRDRVEFFGVTFLGLTTGCAACHDHKFDPLTARDFYALAAFLGNTAEKPWDYNTPDPLPVLRLPPPGRRAEVEAAIAERAELLDKLESRRTASRRLMAEWLAAGQRPRPVDATGLEVRLRFDEGRGDVVRNSAPGAAVAEFRAEVNPLVWGETNWAWAGMRMDMSTRLSLGSVADIDTADALSVGGWIMLRQKTGGGHTGDGSLIARRGDAKKLEGRGWDLYQRDARLEVNLAHDAKHVLTVATIEKLPRYEWQHVAFTYDGSGRAAGLALYVNGRRVETKVVADTLAPGQSVRTTAETHLGRRDDSDPLRETSYQDVRIYRRTLSPAEVARWPFEDLAAEIVARQPDPAKWSTLEAFIAADRFFIGEQDGEGRDLHARLVAAEARLQELTKTGEPTLIAREKSTPAFADVLTRGDYFARAERVEPQTPHFLPPLPEGKPRNRRGLAEWLVTPEQPLFARVAVNRMWQELFGTGIVDSPGDFGVMGSRPTHPELLDWLAVEFRESGWDVKRMYRTLVLSATYRQSARVRPADLQKDPANRFLARGPRYRMDGEVLRDSALAAAGLLSPRLGGPPVKPYQPGGLWEEVAMPESNTRTYIVGHGDQLYRRSVYTFWKRSSPPPAFETFDSPSRELACVRRPRSNTPLQAFVTMNDRQWIEASRKLAERVLLSGHSSTEARLQALAGFTLGRPLSAREKGHFQAPLAEFVSHYRADANAAILLLGVGDSSVAPGVDSAELAAWTMVASQFLNLDEFLTK